MIFGSMASTVLWQSFLCVFFVTRSRLGICQKSYTSISFNFTGQKCAIREVFGKKLRMRMFYSSYLIKVSVFLLKSSKFHLLWETYNNPSLNSATYTEKVIFCINSWKLNTAITHPWSNQVIWPRTNIACFFKTRLKRAEAGKAQDKIVGPTTTDQNLEQP